MAQNIKDVAQLARVSSATVSRVLTGKSNVSDELHKRVMQAVKELEYHPSRVARSLRISSSQIVSLIISDIQNPFFTSLVRAVEDRANSQKYNLFLCNSDEDPTKEAVYIDLMLSEKVAGVIITPAHETCNNIQKLIKANIPVVAVDRRVKNVEIDTVILDNISASYNVVKLLIENGHRHIGAVLASKEITTGYERYLGYLKALNEWNIPIDENLIRTGIPKEHLGYRYTSELLALSRPPTAILTGNNLLAIGALKAISDHQLRIPEDLSLVTFDDMEWATLIQPKITVVSQPTYEMGLTAANLILDRILDPERPAREVLFKAHLKIRESIASPRTERGGKYSS